MTRKDIAAYAADTMSQNDRARYEEHIGECAQCRAMHLKMRSAMAPRFRHLHASERTRERIMRSWREIGGATAAGGPAGVRALVRQHPRVFVASACAVVAILAVIAVSVLRESPGSASLTVGGVGGKVILNGVSAHEGDAVAESGRIVVHDNSTLQLVHKDAIKISLVNRSDIILYRLSMDSSSRVRLGAALEEGIILSAAHGGSNRIAYEYRTPSALIEPLGTEFLLQAYRGATLVIVKSGSVRVTDIRSGKSEIVQSERKYILANGGTMLPAAGKDMEIFVDLNGLRGGSYESLLLPAVLGGRARSADAVRAAEYSGSGGTSIMHGEKNISPEGRRNELEERRKSREELNKDVMRQRMMDRKIQMNEIRRGTRTDAAPRMRLGR